MARIPANIVDQIYNATDIVDIISDYFPLKKKGANYWGLSPFSNEKSPSFSVHPGKGIYKDFSSGKGGNAINFLMEMEGYEYVEALKHIARKYNIEIVEEEETAEVKEQRDKRQSFFIVNEFAAEYFQDQLLNSSKGRQIGLSYFKERGILESTVKDFQLGYCHDEWEVFAKAAIEKKYKEEYLVELGLVSKSQKTGNLIDRFRGRIMFPITNQVGKVVGFGGRILGTRKDVGKYINSPESEIYHKSQVLYGLSLAKKHIRDKDLCILTEGYMDTIVLHQYGIQNVVASSGTALTPDQIRLIRRFTKNVLMIYDGDAAGVKAATRGIDLLLKEGLATKVLILPDNHDPDSYVTEFGPDKFLQTIEKEALGFIDFKMRVMTEGKNADEPQVQAELIRGLAETLAHIPDEVQRQMFIKHVAQKVDITEGLMTRTVQDAKRQVSKLEARTKRRESAVNPTVPTQGEVKDLKGFEQLALANQEKELLRVMVCHYDKSFLEEEGASETTEGEPIEQEETPMMEYLMVELEDLSFENQTYERLKIELFNEFDQSGGINLNPYLNHKDSAICRLVSDLLTAPEVSPFWNKIRPDLAFDHNRKKVIEGAVFHYKSKKIEKLIRECGEKIKVASDAEEIDRLMTFYQKLLQMRKGIHSKLGTEGAIRGTDGRL